MNSRSSPQYKNLGFKHKQSPKELKEKFRKSYKEKVQNCREMLMDRFRGTVAEQDLCNTLTDIYKSVIDFNVIENDELEILEELKNELVQEELDWWIREYEKSQLDNVDWSSMEQDDEVICPICQKSNLKLANGNVSCSNCKTKFNTSKKLTDIKKSIVTCLEKHATLCTQEPQFTVIPDLNESHIYLICEICSEMNVLI
ncbi:putative RPA interacting protein [Operophtera brumata]|uniref:Putative RPA interacting protein n=1 Tax=Operophtera brumata TaxID=104452 RepID=A0A0L7LTE4_OPEBR|nr:putative RPA interacting protein [Operophtera brumata]